MFLFSLFFLTVLLRHRHIAVAALVLIVTAAPNPVFPLLVGDNPIVTVVCRGLWAAGFVLVLARVGLLAGMVSLFVNWLSTLGLITFNLSVPSSQTSYLIVGAIVVVLAIYGVHTAIAGRPVLGAGFLKDEIGRIPDDA